MDLIRLLAVLGLELDIVGAYFLVGSLMFKMTKTMSNETVSGAFNPPNIHYIRNGLGQKNEAWIGFSLMTLGFSLQLLANLLASYWQFSVPPVLSITIIVIGVLGALCGAIFAKSHLNKRAWLKAAKFIAQKEGFKMADVYYRKVGEQLLGMTLKKGESEQAFAERAKQRLGYRPNP